MRRGRGTPPTVVGAKSLLVPIHWWGLLVHEHLYSIYDLLLRPERLGFLLNTEVDGGGSNTLLRPRGKNRKGIPFDGSYTVQGVTDKGRGEPATGLPTT